jgi:hypothetical protein
MSSTDWAMLWLVVPYSRLAAAISVAAWPAWRAISLVVSVACRVPLKVWSSTRPISLVNWVDFSASFLT